MITSFASLPHTIHLKILYQLTKEEQESAELVCLPWFRCIAFALCKPRHALLTDNANSLKILQNCSRNYLNSLTVTNCQEHLPIVSSTRSDLPRSCKLTLKPGISQVNVLKLLRYHVTTTRELVLVEDCLANLELFHIKSFRFSNLTAFSFQLRGFPSTNCESRSSSCRKSPSIQINDKQIQVLTQMFSELNIQTLTSIGGTFPHDSGTNELHKSFARFLARHGAQIKTASIQVGCPIGLILPFLEAELKPLVNLKNLALFGVNGRARLDTNVNESFKGLVQIVGSFSKLKTLSTNLDNAILQDILVPCGIQLESLIVTSVIQGSQPCPWLHSKNLSSTEVLQFGNMIFGKRIYDEALLSNQTFDSLYEMRIFVRRAWHRLLVPWILQVAQNVNQLILMSDGWLYATTPELFRLIQGLNSLKQVELHFSGLSKSVDKWCQRTVGIDGSLVLQDACKSIYRIDIDRAKFI